jgi:GAF domain-containing protein
MRGIPEPVAERFRDGFRGADAPASGPLVAGERFVHIPDMAEVEQPIARAVSELAGTRTLLSVPLRKGDRLFGTIVATRPEVRPFSDKQIALLESFAAQAVIAIENGG